MSKWNTRPVIGNYCFDDLNRINILLGKNGCGKSTKLREIAQLEGYEGFYIRYITPERAGQLAYVPGEEARILGNQNGFSRERQKNQHPSFKQQTAAQYRILEDIIRDEIEHNKGGIREDLNYKFDVYIEKLNSLLEHIAIKRQQKGFACHCRRKNDGIPIQEISSGESELITLGIESLVFAKQTKKDMWNLLLLDEPDVHLHPDLQVRFMKFIHTLAMEYKFKVILATHSTAILGALSDSKGDLSVLFMRNNSSQLESEYAFFKADDMYNKILPVFGAHPLSNMFNESPILLVEGEDDVRIWQQAVRSSEGRIKLYPCSTETVDKMHDYEQLIEKIAGTIYDSPKAFSLRDGDDKAEKSIEAMPIVKRMRLNCRASENLLLSNDVLTLLKTNWDKLQTAIEGWLNANQPHTHYDYMKSFKDSSFDRRNHDLKDIRNILIGLAHPSKPWEVAVGQAIAHCIKNEQTSSGDNHSLSSYLGEKLVTVLRENK